MKTNSLLHIQDLGRIDYQKAWDYQQKLSAELIETKLWNRHNPTEARPIQHYLLFCEHPHVYTLPRKGDANNLLISEAEMQALGAHLVINNRGGQVTYHGQGQLVVYFVLDLEDIFTDVNKYIRGLEEMIINVLKNYHIAAGRIPSLSGVWLDPDTPQARKICAIGIHLSRWVSTHGIAFNIHTDLSYFEHIIPCGITDKAVTSLEKETQLPIHLSDVKQYIQIEFEKIFCVRE